MDFSSTFLSTATGAFFGIIVGISVNFFSDWLRSRCSRKSFYNSFKKEVSHNIDSISVSIKAIEVYKDFVIKDYVDVNKQYNPVVKGCYHLYTSSFQDGRIFDLIQKDHLTKLDDAYKYLSVNMNYISNAILNHINLAIQSNCKFNEKNILYGQNVLQEITNKLEEIQNLLNSINEN